MSRNVTLSNLLVLVLVVSVLASLGLCYRYVRTLSGAERASARAQVLQQQVLQVNRNRAIMQRIVVDAAEYAKRNAAMTPVLQESVQLLQQLNMLRPADGSAQAGPASTNRPSQPAAR